MASIKSNVVANYFGQFYAVFLSLAIQPIYLKVLGSEGYGLVGFFTVLLSLMQIVDLGISPTLGREVSALRCTDEGAKRLRIVVRTLEYVFGTASILSVLALLLFREPIAMKWLNFNSLSESQVKDVLSLMAITLGFRLGSLLHRSGVSSYEKQVWLSVFDAVIATFRLPGSILLLMLVNGDLTWFFSYQLIVACIEQVLVTAKFYSLMPPKSERIKFDYGELKRLTPFVGSVAYTGTLWALSTQIDKIVLSKILTLTEFGYFTLISVVSGGLMMLAVPVGKAVGPRMTALVINNDISAIKIIYGSSTRLLSCVVSAVAITLVIFPYEVMLIWTGDRVVANWSIVVLPQFALGSLILALSSLTYSLQYAYGRLRQHVIYSTVSSLISIPAMALGAIHWGALGVSWVWLSIRFISFLVWVPYVHKVFLPGYHLKWLLRDVLAPVLAGAVPFLSMKLLDTQFDVLNQYGRFQMGMLLALCASSGLLFSFLISFYKSPSPFGKLFKR